MRRKTAWERGEKGKDWGEQESERRGEIGRARREKAQGEAGGAAGEAVSSFHPG